ncbi:MAG: VanZ family protein [Acidobacteria bacterium]|nr:VanZ family protein [Acidobacteriota bacterium]
MSSLLPERPPIGSGQPPCGVDPRLRWWRWLAVAGYMGVLFFLSAQSTLPELPAALPGIPADKVEHFVAYGVLSLLVVWAVVAGQWRSITCRTAVIAIVISSAYGYSDEYHQLFVPNRSYDLMDWAADISGASAAAALTWAWSILLPGRHGIHGL